MAEGVPIALPAAPRGNGSVREPSARAALYWGALAASIPGGGRPGLVIGTTETGGRIASANPRVDRGEPGRDGSSDSRSGKRRSTRSSSRASSSTSSPRAAIPSRAYSSSGINSGTPRSSTGSGSSRCLVDGNISSGSSRTASRFHRSRSSPSPTAMRASRRFRCPPVERSALRRSPSSQKEALNSRRQPPDPGGSTPEVLTVQCQLPPRAFLVARALLTARVFLLLATSPAPRKRNRRTRCAQERTAFTEWLEDRPCVSARRSRSAADRGRPYPGSGQRRTYRSRALQNIGSVRPSGHVALRGSGGVRPISRGVLIRTRRVRRDRRWNSRPDGGHGVRTITKAICPRLLPGHP